MLRLKQITINDLGNYTCEAENSQGLARDHIELSGNVYLRTDFRRANHGCYLFFARLIYFCTRILLADLIFFHKMPRLFGRLCQEMLVVLIFKSISRRWRWPLSIELNCCLLLDQKDSKYGNFPKSRIVSNSNIVPEDDFSNHENSCKKAYSKFLEQHVRVAYTYAQKCTHFYYFCKKNTMKFWGKNSVLQKN